MSNLRLSGLPDEMIQHANHRRDSSGADQFRTRIGGELQAVAGEDRPAGGPQLARMTVQIPDSSDAILEEIAKEKFITKVEALRRLLAVLEIVHIQKLQGNHLALVDGDGNLVSRLIG
jgi:hypothetical protein